MNFSLLFTFFYNPEIPHMNDTESCRVIHVSVEDPNGPCTDRERPPPQLQ